MQTAQWINLQWKPGITNSKGLGKCVRYNGSSLHRGSFPYILLSLGWKIWFVIPGSSLYRGSTVYCSTEKVTCVKRGKTRVCELFWQAVCKLHACVQAARVCASCFDWLRKRREFFLINHRTKKCKHCQITLDTQLEPFHIVPVVVVLWTVIYLFI